jgi:sugar phosphate isomerase/epimerase
MTRPVTLFTGQWSDLPFERVCELAGSWGYDGLEVACRGDHFDAIRALGEPDYLPTKRSLLERHGLRCLALSAHPIGQATLDPIDDRHRLVLPADVWGDGDPEGVHVRAAERIVQVAEAAAAFGVTRVNGFTGSPIWHLLYSYPENDWSRIEAAYTEFADRWNPIIDRFDELGVRFALEVHPTEIAYDFVTTRKTLAAIGRRPGFGLNFDPSHLLHQGLDPILFIEEFGDRIYHVHIKDVRRRLDGTRSLLGSHLAFGDRGRGWNFCTPGHGEVDFVAIVEALNSIGYSGPLSVEWEDAAVDREWGAREALGFVRRLDFPPGTPFT